jgi:hypothetical protein
MDAAHYMVAYPDSLVAHASIQEAITRGKVFVNHTQRPITVYALVALHEIAPTPLVDFNPPKRTA